MATLSRRYTFKRWAPDLGENRSLPESERLWLEVAAGLTAKQMSECRAAAARVAAVDVERPDTASLSAADAEAAWRVALDAHTAKVRDVLAEALGEYVRIVGGPHTVDGRPVATLADYIGLVQESEDMGVAQLLDLRATLEAHNSISGGDELFSLRRSGGRASTGGPSVVKDEGLTGAR